ncbi:MAG: hypothetical protein R3A80_11925 [Bdellovibrionota bacterium]
MFRNCAFIALFFVLNQLEATQHCWWQLTHSKQNTAKKLKALIKDPADSSSHFTTHTDFHLKILGRIAGEPAKVLSEADKVFSTPLPDTQGVAATVFADLLVTQAIHENAWAALAYGLREGKDASSGVRHIVGELFPEIRTVDSLASFPERQHPLQVTPPQAGSARDVLYKRMQRDFKKLLSLAQAGDNEAIAYLRSKSAMTIIEEYHNYLFDSPTIQFPAYLKIAQIPPVKAQMRRAIRFMAREHGLTLNGESPSGRLLFLYKQQRSKGSPADEALDILSEGGAFNPGIHRNTEVAELVSELSKDGDTSLALNVARNYTLGPKELGPDLFQKLLTSAKNNLERLAKGPNNWAFEQADVHAFFQDPSTGPKLKALANTLRELRQNSGDESLPIDSANILQRSRHDGPILDVASYMSSRFAVEISYIRDWLSLEDRKAYYLGLLNQAQAASQPEVAELFFRLSGEN